MLCAEGVLGLDGEAAPQHKRDECHARTDQQNKVLYRRLLAEQQVVDHEEQVLPRGHNHLDRPSLTTPRARNYSVQTTTGGLRSAQRSLRHNHVGWAAARSTL